MSPRSRSPRDAIPPPPGYAWLRGPLGALVLRPWFDRVALRSLIRLYFPVSRAWAAGLESGADWRRFAEALRACGGGPVPRLLSEPLARGLKGLARRRQGYEAAEAAWLELAFAAAAPAPGPLAAAERTRRRAAHRLMRGRDIFLPLALSGRVPPLRWEIAPPAAVAERHGPRLAEPETAFPAPESPEIAVSHPLARKSGTERWLNFAAPAAGDRAWARVFEPAGGAAAPTLVFLHGIGMEPEMWQGLADATAPLAAAGLRVVQPEGPWHGRRRAEGWYGGEPAMGRGPLGLIELFEAWVAETAALIAWARATGGGPVALGGVSLGALTAGLAATAARNWPAACRPDALLLVAGSGDMLETAYRGSLVRALKLPEAIGRHGWSEAELARWLPLIEPQGPPAMPPGRIVMLLGAADDLVPVAGGDALAKRWAVPEANVFRARRGHFSVSLGLLHDPAPLARLAGILKAL